MEVRFRRLGLGLRYVLKVVESRHQHCNPIPSHFGSHRRIILAGATNNPAALFNPLPSHPDWPICTSSLCACERGFYRRQMLLTMSDRNPSRPLSNDFNGMTRSFVLLSFWHSLDSAIRHDPKGDYDDVERNCSPAADKSKRHRGSVYGKA